MKTYKTFLSKQIKSKIKTSRILKKLGQNILADIYKKQAVEMAVEYKKIKITNNDTNN